MTLQPSGNITTSGYQPLTKMSIAFLLDYQNDTEPIDLAGTREYRDSIFTPSQVPMAHLSPWMPPSDRTEMENMLLDATLAQPSRTHCPYINCLFRARSVKGDIDNSNPSSGHISSSGAKSFSYDPVSVSSGWSISFHQPSSSIDRSEAYQCRRRHDHHVQVHTSADAPTCEARSARPSYNEEQKFFIMYYRLVERLSWPEIEERFAKLFKLRSKNGLTSVYYRIRRSWGMEQVLENLARPENDLSIVESRASRFPRAFLDNIGYFD
jgi:hypothetical protein